MGTIDEIIDSLKKGQGRRVTELVKIALDEGVDSQAIVEEGFLKGMEEIGGRFREEEVGTPEILSITRALEQGVQSLRKYTGGRGMKEIGTAVIGTIKGDVHDIGKNLVKMMLESRNIYVIDLGVDVSPRKFVEETIASRAKVLCLSGIMERTVEDMKEVVEAFEEKGLRDKVFIMVGGYFLNDQLAVDIGADCYTEDACACAQKAYEYLTKKEKKKK